VHIDLDYYRILSVPIRASSQQIAQAYQDRLRQQSRREYSENAIAARSQLLHQAYTILSDSEKRSQYDTHFFAPTKTEPVEELLEIELDSIVIPEDSLPVNPYIEIKPELLIGALIILYELAEYEIIINLATDYLSTQNTSLQSEKSGVATTQTDNLASDTTSEIANETEPRQDIVLCLALAYQELSREQWRRGEFEKAARSGQTGLDWLQQEANHFLALQREMITEFNSLKPYRVLELLEPNPPNSPSRLRGLELLKEMLCQRQGMEGSFDPSGLNSDQFLCFIQQVRTYLTLQEQKEVFLAETERGSNPGSLVAAHALIAEGYAYKKPSSILQAQNIFKKLNNINNYHWERAICALLLGKTAEAQREIEHSLETNTLELIKKRSLDAPDLLPGLCFYGEQWLQQKVLSQFPNLKSHQITLEEYFDDSHVQAELDRISPITPTNNQTVTTKDTASVATKTKEQTKRPKLLSWWGNKKRSAPTPTRTVPPTEKVPSRSLPLDAAVAAASASRNGTPINTVTSSSVPTNNKLKPQKRKAAANTKKNIRRKKNPKNSSSHLKSRLLLLTSVCFGIGVLAFIFTKSQLESSPEVAQSVTPSPNIEPTPVTSEVESPEVIPEVTAEATATELNPELARAVIQEWLDSKAAALGEKRQIERLDSILTGSLLTLWRDRSTNYQQNNIYRQFEHTLDIESVTVDAENTDIATVEAKVTEIAQHYRSGQIDLSQSYNDNLLVRYELVRQNDSWLIKNSEVLQTL
jgi:curved DNA-binding protein CbpA